jgi:hypothetical protein
LQPFSHHSLLLCVPCHMFVTTDKEYLAKLSKGAIVTQPLDLSLNRPGKKRNRFMPMTKEEVAQQQQQQAAASAAGSSAAAGMSSYAASVSSPGGGAPAAARAGMGMGGGGLPTAQQGSPNSKVGKTAYGQSPASAQNLATSSTGFGAAPSHNNPYVAQHSHAQQMHSPVVKQEPSSGPQSPSMGMGMRPAAPNFNGTVQPQSHPPQHPQQPQQQSPWNATSATTVAPPPPPPAAAAPAPHSNWQAALQSSTAHSMGLAHPPQQPQPQVQPQAQPPSHPTSNPYASSSRPSIAPPQSHFGGSSSSSMSSTAASSPSMSAAAHAGLFPSAPAANQTYVPSSMARPTPSAFTGMSGTASSSSASSTMSTTAVGIISSSSRVDDDLDDDALLHMAERHSPQKPKPMDGTSSNSHSTTAAASTTAAGSTNVTAASNGVTDGAKRTLSMQPQPSSSVGFGEERKDGSPAAAAVSIGSGPFFTQQPRNVAAKPPSPPQPRVLTSADLLGDPEHEPTASRSL